MSENVPKRSKDKARSLTAQDLGLPVPTMAELRTVLLPPVTPGELNFILAGLRLLQKEGMCDADRYPSEHQEIVELVMVPDPAHDDWLTAEEVDDLCEHLNCDSRRMPEGAD